MTRRRLDAELVRRGMATNRSEAQAAVESGIVRVRGAPATKAATMVAAEEPLELARPGRRFVSRGGDKLRAGLDRFGIDPTGLDCLDAGASTGGFTDCLLSAGAARVIAVDVGYGQLAWGLRNDERVAVLERTNVRDLRQELLPFPPALVAVDLSFISLRLVARPLSASALPGSAFLMLIKPQFEAPPEEVPHGGVVRDPDVWARVIADVAAEVSSAGIVPEDLMASPVLGPAGNVEFLMLGRSDPGPWATGVAGAGHEERQGRPDRAPPPTFEQMVEAAVAVGSQVRGR